jgi:hypothetical protein
VLCNAKCLSEGIDVPSLDAVAFVDPRSSQVDIVQAVGRAMRNSAGKELGYVVVSVYLGPGADIDDTNLDETLNGDGFKTLWNVLRAMRSHDEQLSELLDEYRFQLGHKGAGHSLADHIVIDLPNMFDAALMAKFVDAIEVRAVEMTTSNFQTGLGHLAAYVTKHGDANVKQTEVTEDGFRLGFWLTRRRSDFRFGILGPHAAAALNGLGVVWEPAEVVFLTGVGYLQAFKDEYGHATVQKGWSTEDGFPLGDWLSSRRQEFKAGALSAERIELLEDLGVDWDLQELAFQNGVRRLSAFIEVHGHANPPKKYFTEDGFALGDWLGTRRVEYRRGDLAADRIAVLDGLGVVWDLREEGFQLGVGHLIAFAVEHGHVDTLQRHVTADGFRLGVWLNTQRQEYKKNRLPAARIAVLEGLGVIWDVAEAAFQDGLQHLQAFQDEHGHVHVKQSYVTADGFRLGAWLSNRRQGAAKLSKARIAALTAVNPAWAASRP